MLTYSEQSTWNNLIQAAKSGDNHAVDEIVIRLRDYLLVIANGESDGRLAAKFGNSDIVQQTLLDAHRGFADFQGNSEYELRAWLKKIVLRNILDFSRGFTSTQARDVGKEQFIEHFASSTQPSETPSQLLSRCETDHELLSAIEQLPERQRFVVEARHRWDWSYSEIAAELGATEVAARKLWSRALKNLKQLIACD